MNNNGPIAGFDDLAWFLVRTELMSVVVGLLLGAIGGAVITWSRQRGWMSDTWAQTVHADGCVALLRGRWAVGRQRASRRVRRWPRVRPSWPNGQGVAPTRMSQMPPLILLELVIFAMFGAYAVVEAWRDVGWRVVAFAFVAVFGVRLNRRHGRAGFVPTCRLKTGCSSDGSAPRGLGTMVLGLIMIEHSDAHLEYWITQAVGVTVSLSLLVHSLTVWPGINWLATKEPVEVAKIGSSTSLT